MKTSKKLSKIAILTPKIGTLTTTFIRQHIEEICPGRVVVVADSYAPQVAWTPNCPSIVLNELSLLMRARGTLGRGFVRSSKDNQRVKRMLSFLKKENVETVLGEYLHWSLPLLEAARGQGFRTFAHAHGIDVSHWLDDEETASSYLKYNDHSGLITMSEFSKRRLVSLGIRDEKIHVNAYGVSVPASFSVRPIQPTITCIAVGRLTAKKSPILLLDAFRRAQIQVPQLRLRVIGGGELLPAVEQFIVAFDLQRVVSTLGPIKSELVIDEMASADIFIQHSRTDPETGDQEGLPNSILEAMANGLPILSTEHAGIPEAVIDEKSGFLVPEGNSQLMAEKLIQLANDSNLRNAFGRIGWERAKNFFNKETQIKKLRDLLVDQ